MCPTPTWFPNHDMFILHITKVHKNTQNFLTEFLSSDQVEKYIRNSIKEYNLKVKKSHFICDECEVTELYQSEKELNEHFLKKHRERLAHAPKVNSGVDNPIKFGQCLICHLDVDDAATHMSDFHPNYCIEKNYVSCPECVSPPAYFKSQEDLDEHLNLKHNLYGCVVTKKKAPKKLVYEYVNSPSYIACHEFKATRNNMCNLCGDVISRLTEDINHHFLVMHPRFVTEPNQIKRNENPKWTLCFKCQPFRVDHNFIKTITCVCHMCNSHVQSESIFKHIDTHHADIMADENNIKCLNCDGNDTVYEAWKSITNPIGNIDKVRYKCKLCNAIILKSEIATHFTFDHYTYCKYFQWSKCDFCDLRLDMNNPEIADSHSHVDNVVTNSSSSVTHVKLTGLPNQTTISIAKPKGKPPSNYSLSQNVISCKKVHTVITTQSHDLNKSKPDTTLTSPQSQEQPGSSKMCKISFPFMMAASTSQQSSKPSSSFIQIKKK